jgi:hypothetical protein
MRGVGSSLLDFELSLRVSTLRFAVDFYKNVEALI